MKLIGIVGGIGPESTIDYYRLFISIYRERRPEGGYPPVVINSIDLARVLKLVSSNDLAGLAAYMLEEVRRLARAGATHGLLSSNTPHIVFDELRRASPIPLISIVETASRAAAERKLKRVGLFGTRFTMQGGFYQKVFAREAIEVVIPESGDQEFIHDTYLNELVNGVVVAATRERYIAIARRMKSEQGIEALILGGTELPLLLRDAIDIGMMLLDTARLHVEAAVSELLSDEARE
jgi:aspartate racemase